MIQISRLHFRYTEGDFALRVPDLTVEKGEAVAMIGPSGSGKTTLLSLMAGIRTPETGEIRTAGTEMGALDEAGRRDFRIRTVGLVFQEFELLEYLSVLDNILLPYRISAALRLDAPVRERARELAREVGLGDKVDRYANLLSQGEKQRVAVCRALLARPPLILADEPTGNLDPTNKGHVLDILFDYTRSSGATLVTVTHDHEILDRFDRVVDFRDFYDLGEAGPDEETADTEAAS
jgi:putative ABC transport system ATP-binding protein